MTTVRQTLYNLARMESDYNSPQTGGLATQVQQAQATSRELSNNESKKGRRKKFLVLLSILGLAIFGIVLIASGLGGSTEEIIITSPTPTIAGVAVNTSTPDPTPSPEPEEKVDRTEVSISILNGTGISGEAGLLLSDLEDLGYENIDTGNATSLDNEDTSVTFSSDLSDVVVDEVTKLLETVYQKVDIDTTTADTDIEIITGLRKDQTPLPTAEEDSE